VKHDVFSELRVVYPRGDIIEVRRALELGEQVLARTAFGKTFDASGNDHVFRLENLPVGTHAVELRASDGTLLAEEFVGVRESPGDDPIMGFVTSFQREVTPSVLRWLRELRCTVVQVYDWMESYSAPLATTASYHDPLGRPIERGALEDLIGAIKASGAVAQAYAPVCAADEAFASAHRDWLLYRNDGAPESLGNLLQIMDPASELWQQYWIDNYGHAVDVLGFNGFHLDTYGYPRNALDASGNHVPVESGYAEFVTAVRAARPRDVISFNQVNGVPREFIAPVPPGFRYSEVWPPNEKWRHLEGLLQRSAGTGDTKGATLAIYPPVWEGERTAALRTAVLSEAVLTTLGANALLWGDQDGVLCHPYYVNHEQLDEAEKSVALTWHRFGLRCRDLFKVGVDTSWYELSDENASVVVTWQGPTSPEPVEKSLFARVVRDDKVVAVSLLDLTGSADGSWHSRTAPGTCGEVDVTILVDVPEGWVAAVAVLGRDEGRFTPLAVTIVPHREGRALLCRVPVDKGWAVLRLVSIAEPQ
jgi:dextranase